MEEDTSAEVASEPGQTESNPTALSLAGGTFGTLVGLKRGGVPGALAGGLVGGTTGYLVGAVSQEPPQPHEGSGRDVNPIQVETDEQSGDDSGSQSDGDADDSDESADTGGTDDGDET